MSAEGRPTLFVAGGRLRAGWRIAIYVACYVALLLVVQLPLGVAYVAYVMARGGGDFAALQAAIEPDALPLWAYTAFKLAEVVALVPMTYALRRWVDRRPFRTLGFHLDRQTAADLALGLALGGGQVLLVFAVSWAAGWLSVGWLSAPGVLQGLLDSVLLLALFCVVALGEELMFRGYLQVNAADGIGALPALCLVSLAFGLYHGLNPNLRWLGLLNIAFAGLVFGYARLVTGNLWLPIAYHLSWNWTMGALVALPVSGVRFGGLLSVVDRGVAPLWTGGPFGPEGGLLATAALLTALPVLWLWGRRRRPRPAA
ncbi:MAG: CPBP family intramembrane metalloprotease [Anaerolineae bacterium]|nr:CPBP family intramembrane metalloprotease [Anaerolineae bacterium]